MIIKERGGLRCEPMSTAIYQIANVGLDRVILATEDTTAKYQIKIPDGGFQPTLSYIGIHTFYHIMSNKVYVEYYISRDMKKLLQDAWVALDRFIWGSLHAMYFENSIHTWPEVITTEDPFDKVTDSRYLLTPYTITFWKNFHGKFQFIEDKAMINHWKSNYTINNPKYDWRIYHQQIHDINIRYGLNKDMHLNIPDAFGEYAALFKEYFKRDLNIGIYPQMPDADENNFDYDFFDAEEVPDVKLEKDYSFDPISNPEMYVYINYVTRAEMGPDKRL